MRRELAGEALGTALLLYVVVGSGITAERLGNDQAVQLLAHALVVGLGLAALIAMLQTVSGSHFNPAVTLGLWRTGSLDGTRVPGYLIAQVLGAMLGVAAANLSFTLAPITVSRTARDGVGLVLAEGIATFVLVLVIVALVHSHRPAAIPAAVGAWVAAVVFATSSTGFANPAVTISRALTDSYTGIAPHSIPWFVVAQLVAAVAAAATANALFEPSMSRRAAV